MRKTNNWRIALVHQSTRTFFLFSLSLTALLYKYVCISEHIINYERLHNFGVSFGLFIFFYFIFFFIIFIQNKKK